MEFIIILFLLLLNGIFAMYEIALVSSNKAHLRILSEKGNTKATSILRQLEEPEKFLSTIQIGITLIGIISGAFGGIAISDDISVLFTSIPQIAPYAKDLAMVITIIVITYLSLVIGELVPKSIALKNPERYAMLLSPLIVFLSKVALPFVYLLSFSTKLINRLIGIRKNNASRMTQDDLKMILRQSSEQGVISKDETEMLKDVFRFSAKRANELMTHRRDIVMLYTTDSKKEVIQTIRKKHFSKYPLMDKDRGEIDGIVSVKDIILMMGDTKDFNLRKIAKTPLYIPERLYLKKVLKTFKHNKRNFAIVVDEYGSIMGLITLYDLVESIFGDIQEENETEKTDIIIQQDGSMLVNASMNITDFMEEMNITDYNDLKETNLITLSGLAMYIIGKIPKTGDLFEYKDLYFKIISMDKGRVDKLVVTKKNQ